MDSLDIIERLMLWILLVVSLSVHEWAHAWSAWKLGDDTAALLGRLTFNPLAHIDPIGTVILPLLGVPFGWAKPVPVNPLNFRKTSPRAGMMITAIAGPISNIVLATMGVLMLIALLKFGRHHPNFAVAAIQTLFLFIKLNLVLAVFNMIPIPPLDGSKIADFFMPPALRPAWESFLGLGAMPLLLLIVLPQFLGMRSPVAPVLDKFQDLIFAIINWSV